MFWAYVMTLPYWRHLGKHIPENVNFYEIPVLSP